jgi:hypothetical protein
MPTSSVWPCGTSETRVFRVDGWVPLHSFLNIEKSLRPATHNFFRTVKNVQKLGRFTMQEVRKLSKGNAGKPSDPWGWTLPAICHCSLLLSPIGANRFRTRGKREGWAEVLYPRGQVHPWGWHILPLGVKVRPKRRVKNLTSVCGKEHRVKIPLDKSPTSTQQNC